MNHDIPPLDLERHITHCENLMNDAMARFKLSGSFEDTWEAYGWRVAMERAIEAREPAVVDAMERDRGIA